MDEFGVHSLTCGSDRSRNSTHNWLRDRMLQIIADTGVKPLKEQAFSAHDAGLKMDITVPNYNDGAASRLVDVSVTHPGATSYLPRYRETDYFEKATIQRKLTRYPELKAGPLKPKDNFTVFAVSPYGRIGKHGHKLLDTCAEAYAEKFATPYVGKEKKNIGMFIEDGGPHRS